MCLELYLAFLAKVGEDSDPAFAADAKPGTLLRSKEISTAEDIGVRRIPPICFLGRTGEEFL